ncbi:MAG: 30S ribosomal protein S9 [Janthinobacterium lividum]
MAKLKVKNPTTAVTKKNKLSSPLSNKLIKDTPQAYGTGRRKNAIARVWVRPGSGIISVNKRIVDSYFSREAHVKSIMAPFAATNSKGQYDIICTVKGGGLSGQAGAIIHGVARALDILVPDFHQALRQGGFLTRDSRVVERKKYGKHKARKSTQFSKR